MVNDVIRALQRGKRHLKANEGNRTPDRTLTKRLLYRLSYVGVRAIIPEKNYLEEDV